MLRQKHFNAALNERPDDIGVKQGVDLTQNQFSSTFLFHCLNEEKSGQKEEKGHVKTVDDLVDHLVKRCGRVDVSTEQPACNMPVDNQNNSKCLGVVDPVGAVIDQLPGHHALLPLPCMSQHDVQV